MRKFLIFRLACLVVITLAGYWSVRLAWADRLSRDSRLASRERAVRLAPLSATLYERLANLRRRSARLAGRGLARPRQRPSIRASGAACGNGGGFGAGGTQPSPGHGAEPPVSAALPAGAVLFPAAESGGVGAVVAGIFRHRPRGCHATAGTSVAYDPGCKRAGPVGNQGTEFGRAAVPLLPGAQRTDGRGGRTCSASRRDRNGGGSPRAIRILRARIRRMRTYVPQ